MELHSDVSLQPTSNTQWWINDNPVDLEITSTDTYRLCQPHPIEPGDTLTCQQHHVLEEDMHRELRKYWHQRWNHTDHIFAEAWQRILAFAKAHMPSPGFQLPPLQFETWKAAQRRFKPYAARGPDGYSYEDLQHFPPALQQNPKSSAIITYSMNYRTWSSLRAKQLLRQLQHHSNIPAFGFMPGKEARQIWLPLQALIELQSQQQGQLCGYVADIVKAFEHLPRGPIHLLAEHIGIPSHTIEPWHRFLNHTTRRFKLRESVGEAIPSTSGFPEGCGLSCLAMAIANYHHYAPTVACASFVDNLEIVAATTGQLLHAISVQDAFLEMLGLSCNPTKCCTWAVQPGQRTLLQRAGFQCLQHAKDLGGHMTYRSTRRTAQIHALIAAIQPLWLLLQRSGMATACKQLVIQQALWSTRPPFATTA